MPNSAIYWIGRGEFLYKIVSYIKKNISIFKKIHTKFSYIIKKAVPLYHKCIFYILQISKIYTRENTCKGNKKNNTNQIKLQNYDNY